MENELKERLLFLKNEIESYKRKLYKLDNDEAIDHASPRALAVEKVVG